MIYSDLRLLLGVSSSIAAYRALDIASTIVKGGGEVRVVMTPNATRLVGPAAFAAITGKPVVTSLWESDNPGEMDHLAATKWANVFAIAPATAGTLAHLALGMADDALGTFAIAWPSNLIIAPAMNPTMYANVAVQSHLATLRSRGHRIVEPAVGPVACGDTGQGRLAEVEDILLAVVDQYRASLAIPALAGKNVLITSGPTREFADPVRCITNPSTGRMGVALAKAAIHSGARVTLVTGPCQLTMPDGIARLERVVTAEEMRDAMLKHLAAAHVAVFAAAVSDWRPATRATTKQKKENAPDTMSLELVRTPDVAGAAAASKKTGQFFVGFAAESDNLVENARDKYTRKGFDFVVANPVNERGAGFESETNRAIFVDASSARELPIMPKENLAREIFLEVGRRLGNGQGHQSPGGYPLGLSDA